MQRNNWLVAISVIVIIILLNNTAYFFLTKHTLEQSLEREMTSVARQIELSLEQSRLGSILFEDQIGRELRVAAIAAQFALDPDVEKVSNEELEELSGKLGVNHITLMKRTEDDIVFYKSSDPHELGHGSKHMDPWFKIFNQLFDDKQASENWIGQTLPNFWTGPYEAATTDTEQIYKWGYYYDGTTNYMIDPFVGYDRLKEYESITGVDRLIGQTLEENHSLLEISVINPLTFGKGDFKTVTEDGKVLEHIVQKPVAYGSYEYKFDDDARQIQRAYEFRQPVSSNEWVNGRHLFKMYIPVSIDNEQLKLKMVDENGDQMDSYVLSLVSDYQVVQEQLDQQFMTMGLIILAVTMLSIALALGFMRFYKLSKERAVQVTQQTYVDEINQMFLAIRGQRHDFMNHVQTIQALAEMNKSSELVAYTKELTGEIRTMNDIIHIGNPAVAALIRSKTSQAETYKIRFACQFKGMLKLETGTKTFDFNRMIGNLIDNAFDEVLKYPEEHRYVSITCAQQDGSLELKVANTCRHAGSIIALPLFDAGFSTKRGEHQGLGLSIVRSIVEGYRGELSVAAVSEHMLEFTIRLPQ